MKKVLLFLCMAGLLVLIGACGEGGFWPEESHDATTTPKITPTVTPTPATKTTPTPKKEPTKTLADVWAALERQYPTVTYEDIKTGHYREQYVCIEGVVTDIEKTSIKYSFDIYYPHGETYEKSSVWVDINNDIRLSDLKIMQDGDIVKICVWVYDDDSFGLSSATSATSSLMIIGHTSDDVAALHVSGYKDSCEDIDYRAVLRNPDDYVGNRYKIEGSVFQLLKEEKWQTSLLIETDNGDILYIWFLHFDLVDERILEDDHVTVYGNFTRLESYDSILGTTNTVPYIMAKYIENDY